MKSAVKIRQRIMVRVTVVMEKLSIVRIVIVPPTNVVSIFRTEIALLTNVELVAAIKYLPKRMVLFSMERRRKERKPQLKKKLTRLHL